MNRTDISILLCTYNRCGFLKEVLDRLVGQRLPAGMNFEVVVVDNGSTDQTIRVVTSYDDLKSPQVIYVFEPRKGVAQARNRSIREAHGDWFAFLDDDELAEPNWLGELWRAAERSGTEIVGGAVRLNLPVDWSGQIGRECRRSLRERDVDRFGALLRPCPPGVNPGTDNLMVSRGVVEKVGGFDETMMTGGSDSDFVIRARRAGYVPWYAPAAVVYHQIPNSRLTTEYLRLDSYQSGVMLAFLVRRYRGSFRLAMQVIARIGQGVIVTVPRICWAAISGNRAELLDRQIKLWRLVGFSRKAVAMTFPLSNVGGPFFSKLNFRESRPGVNSGHRSTSRKSARE